MLGLGARGSQWIDVGKQKQIWGVVSYHPPHPVPQLLWGQSEGNEPVLGLKAEEVLELQTTGPSWGPKPHSTGPSKDCFSHFFLG